MKKIGDIMEEMGFSANSTPSSKAAFIKYLAKQAYNVDLQIPEIYKAEEESGEATLDSYLNREAASKEFVKKEEPKQLELNLEVEREFSSYKIA